MVKGPCIISDWWLSLIPSFSLSVAPREKVCQEENGWIKGPKWSTLGRSKGNLSCCNLPGGVRNDRESEKGHWIVSLCGLYWCIGWQPFFYSRRTDKTVGQTLSYPLISFISSEIKGSLWGRIWLVLPYQGWGILYQEYPGQNVGQYVQMPSLTKISMVCPLNKRKAKGAFIWIAHME